MRGAGGWREGGKRLAGRGWSGVKPGMGGGLMGGGEAGH